MPMQVLTQILCKCPVRRALSITLKSSFHATSPPKPQSRAFTCGECRRLAASSRESSPGAQKFNLVSPTPLPSSTRILLDSLKESKCDKWCFVIYRCTYEDDQGWNRFKQMFHKKTQVAMQASDTPEAFDSHEWTFVEDCVALDGASRAQLRTRFNEWAAQAVTAEQPRMLAGSRHVASVHDVPRYNYFIQIDEEALRSMLDCPEDSYLEPRFVNFVDSRWKPFGRDNSGNSDDVDDEVFDSINGCTEENVGWMRVAPSRLDEEFYMMDEVAWYVYYVRPPDVLRY